MPGPRRYRPSGPKNVAKNPITNEPLTFTSSVPHGNVSPRWCASKPDNANRANVPSAPPTATHRYNDIMALNLFGRSHQPENQAVFPDGRADNHCRAQICRTSHGMASGYSKTRKT